MDDSHDSQLQSLIGNMQGVADRLAMGGDYLAAGVVAGGIQAIRALRTHKEPAKKKAAAESHPPRAPRR